MSRLAKLACLPLVLLSFSARAQFGDLLDKAKQKAREAAEKSATEAAQGKKETPAAEQEEKRATQPEPSARPAEQQGTAQGKGSPSTCTR